MTFSSSCLGMTRIYSKDCSLREYEKHLSTKNMQLQQRSFYTQKENNSARNYKNTNKHCDGQFIAKCINYYRQCRNKSIERIVPINQVPYKMLYNAYKKEFNKIAAILSKNNINTEGYIKFFTDNYCVDNDSIKKYLLSQTVLQGYIWHLQRVEKHTKIYGWYVKSVKNIAADCYKLGYFTAKDYLQFLIHHNELGNQVATGRISIYFLAAIPKFNKVIPKLDQLSQDELKILKDRFDIYNTDINEAHMRFKSLKANPLRFCDEVLEKIKQKYHLK